MTYQLLDTRDITWHTKIFNKLYNNVFGNNKEKDSRIIDKRKRLILYANSISNYSCGNEMTGQINIRNLNKVKDKINSTHRDKE